MDRVPVPAPLLLPCRQWRRRIAFAEHNGRSRFLCCTAQCHAWALQLQRVSKQGAEGAGDPVGTESAIPRYVLCVAEPGGRVPAFADCDKCPNASQSRHAGELARKGRWNALRCAPRARKLRRPANTSVQPARHRVRLVGIAQSQ